MEGHELICFEIRKRRKDLGVTIEQLAEMSGVNKTTISTIERGSASPNMATLDKLHASLRGRMTITSVWDEIVRPEDEGED